MTNAGGDGGTPRSGSDEARFAALEAELEALRGELTELRGRVGRIEPRPQSAPTLASSALPPASAPGRSESPLGELLRGAGAPPGGRTTPMGAYVRRSSMSGDAVESWVGRYGTLVAGAFVILLGVGTLVVWAVQRGLLSPEIRVAVGAATTALVAAAGLQFRRRGERRYGNVLLALALAMTAVVAWGAGPRLHIVSTGLALAVVDLVSFAIAALAISDDSEFLFAVAVAGALAAPFVTSDREGRPDVLLVYGAVVLLGGIRALREPTWRRAPILLVLGAAIYELASAGLPSIPDWYGPFLVVLFGGVLALGALLLADEAWRGVLARAFLAAALIGVLFGWDSIPNRSLSVTAAVSSALLFTTYAALWVDRPEQPLWALSALLLPLVPLGIAAARAQGRPAESAVFLICGLVALAMWRAERWREQAARGSAHLLLATVLVGYGTGHLLWPIPLAVVSGLGAVGVAATYLARDEESPLPWIGVVLVFGWTSLSAVDQLASLRPYAYTPFATRASASALMALLSLAGAAAVLEKGRGIVAEWIDRPVRIGAMVAFAFVWGRMEFVHAFSRDAGTFLLTLYYAATGVAGIVAGRRLDSKPFRVAGLAVAIYAGAKAVIEATDIDNLILRVGCYAAVGAFLLGAGYLYRNTEPGSEAVGTESDGNTARESEAVGGGEPASGARGI